MSPEERQLLTALFDRVRTASATPRDHDAEALIDQATREQPYAAYYLAQAVIVQEKGLEAAANHIRQLEERVRVLEADQSEYHKAEQGGGFLSSIFGSSQTPQQPASPTPSSGPWGSTSRQQIQQDRGFDATPRAIQQPTGPWNSPAAGPSAGGSFLQGALGTAAGVAGGMLLANSLSGIFGSHASSLGWGSPLAGSNPFSNTPTEETVINNYFNNDGDKQQAADSTNNNSNDDNNAAGLQQASYDTNDDVAEDDQSDFGNDDSFNA
ncbi:DUF2076 domain-containing protein [Rhizobium grahamii]|uniref:Periplasmic ligand-binding sensor protein n=1 Tax=Rhizobium grahamii CCGE 502 TaxID=990285 RepID=S3HIN8_9HYPH|nr:DUF2076 domain-containing protein [Rhizobium grahamii]EPE97925.1 periplasmic ligand-binding sensor protein [Rhizobium grahamii CCGE 502]